MHYTDVFIKKPVLAVVISLLIVLFGLRASKDLPVQQYPSLNSAVVTVHTVFMGADPDSVATFVTAPLEHAIAQVHGIDYLTSSSTKGNSTISASLVLNTDPDKVLSEISAQITGVLNQLPRDAQNPSISLSVGQSMDAMYLAFYSSDLPTYMIYDYLLRTVQPQIQAVSGVQRADILGNSQLTLRIWLDSAQLAGYGISAHHVSDALTQENFISSAGSIKNNSVNFGLGLQSDLRSIHDFEQLVVKKTDQAMVRLKDIAQVDFGEQNTDTRTTFNGKQAAYIGVAIAPGVSVLGVLDGVRTIFQEIQARLPSVLHGTIVYDSSLFIHEAIIEVIKSLIEAFVIVSLVVFLFLNSWRSVVIPVVTIPLSIVGAFFLMHVFHFSINSLTLLALVLSIGLVVDDAIIVVENFNRHLLAGCSALDAALESARELSRPIIAISIVLIAVYVPIAFMGGITGILFTEFAFTVAGAVAVSAIVALTLSPMMCAWLLKRESTFQSGLERKLQSFITRCTETYSKKIHHVLNGVSVVIVFTIIVLVGNYFLFKTAPVELAPQEDMGVLMNILQTQPQSSIAQTTFYANQIENIYNQLPEHFNTFQIEGPGPTGSGINQSFGAVILKPWSQRHRTAMELQEIVQKDASQISGGEVAIFQPAPLPSSGGGLPIQVVIKTTHSLDAMNELVQSIVERIQQSGLFVYITQDLKFNQPEIALIPQRDLMSDLGLDAQTVARALSTALSENYENYFNYQSRSYPIVLAAHNDMQNDIKRVLNYYVNTPTGQQIPLSQVLHTEFKTMPQSINHFQQMNAVTISGVPAPGVSMQDALNHVTHIAQSMVPTNCAMDYNGQSRQMVQENNRLLFTFIFSLCVIFLSLSVLFNSFRDPLIILISVPLSICGAMIFVSMGIGHMTLNIYTEVGLITLMGLISKHGILIVQFANEQQSQGKNKREAVELAARIRFRPILMTTCSMVLGVFPLIVASGAGSISRFNLGLVIATGLSIGTVLTLFVVPAMYLLIAKDQNRVS